MTLVFEFALEKRLYWLELFLYKMAKNLEHKITLENNNLKLIIKGSEYELTTFSDNLSKAAPASIFISGFNVYAIKDILEDEGCEINIKDEKISNLTPLQALGFKENLEILKNEFGILSSVFIFNEYVNEVNFNTFLDRALNIVKNTEILKFSIGDKEFELEILHKFDGFNFIIPTNPKSLRNIFLFNQRELNALISFEKPIVKLRTSAMFRQNHPDLKTTFDVKFASDFFIFALCDKLFNSGVNFVGVRVLHDFDNLKVCVCQNGSFVYKQSDDSSIFGDHFELSLNKNKPDGLFLVRKNEKIPLLFLPNIISFDNAISMVKKLENGDKLVENFIKTYPIPNENFSQNTNFFQLFCIASKLIGFDENLKIAGEKLLLNAFDFGANRGVLIDCKIDESVFNVAKFIRSFMSFLLAGAQERNISFGAISSLAGFFTNFVLKYADELNLKDVKFSGDLFESEAVLMAFKREFDPNFSLHFDSLGMVISL